MIELLERIIPRKKTRRDLRQVFVPVIFANGRDDDLPGFAAAVENRVFQFDDRTYQPCEDLVIEKRTLAFSCQGLFLASAAGPSEPVPEGWTLICEGDPSRWIHIENCTILFNFRGRP